jgi:glycosyltransferase involved in cell wall biosynthesis
MNICQVGTGSVPVGARGAGGVERFVHYLAQALQSLGHDVTVVDMASEPRPDAPYRLVQVLLRWRADSNLLAHATRGLLFGQAVARRLSRLLQGARFDVVNFHSQFTGLLGIPVARRLGVPAFFTMHNPLWSNEAACRSPWARAKFWMERRAETRADALVYLSEAVKENRRCFFGLDSTKVNVVPLGIDESWFAPVEPSSAIRQKYAPQGEAVVLHVARIAPYKNQMTLVRALPGILREAPATRVVFVGPQDSPRYLKRLQRTVAQAGSRESVVFAGTVPLEELAQLYGLASIFVLPSLQENCPQSLLEAMAQGRAIVASDIAPLRPILKGVAPLVTPLDHVALARAVLTLLRAAESRRYLAERARQRAWDRYRWEVVAQQTAEVYQERLLGSPCPTSRQSGCPIGGG